MRKQCGISLIEILVGFVIIAILVVIGLPNFRAYLVNDQIRRVADEYHSGLLFSKTEAIRRNATVQFNPNGVGWNVNLVADNSVLMSRGVEPQESSIAVNVTAAQLAFTGSGRVQPAANFTIDVTCPTQGQCAASNGTVRCLRVVVSAGGQVSICDPALSLSDPNRC